LKQKKLAQDISACANLYLTKMQCYSASSFYALFGCTGAGATCGCDCGACFISSFEVVAAVAAVVAVVAVVRCGFPFGAAHPVRSCFFVFPCYQPAFA